MTDFGALVRTFGYPAVVLGVVIQGEAILLICGFLAHQGYISLWGVWIVAALSASFGDVAYYTLGHHFGERVLDRLPRGMRAPLQWAKRLVDRHPNKVLVSMRFFFGTRVILPVVCGMSTITIKRFLCFNIPTALLWSAIFVGGGYLYGVAAEKVLKDVQEVEGYLIALIIAGVILYQLRAKRRIAEETETEQSPESQPNNNKSD